MAAEAATAAAAQFTRKELEGRNHRDDACFVIDNVVYNVTGFLDEHPGGHEVLIDNAGRDASQCFHDVGHSEEARQWMRQWAVGEVVPADRREVLRPKHHWGGGPEPLTLTGFLSAAWPPALLALAAWYLYSYLF